MRKQEWRRLRSVRKADGSRYCATEAMTVRDTVACARSAHATNVRTGRSNIWRIKRDYLVGQAVTSLFLHKWRRLPRRLVLGELQRASSLIASASRGAALTCAGIGAAQQQAFLERTWERSQTFYSGARMMFTVRESDMPQHLTKLQRNTFEWQVWVIKSRTRPNRRI